MKTYRGIGLMSGTSLDGLDMAYCEFQQSETNYSFQLLQHRELPYDAAWEARLRHLMDQSAETYAKTHVYYGHWLGRAVRDFVQDYQLRPDFVASHGHTVFHQPDRNLTAQIGDGETMVSYLSCPVVCNFRNKDVALGGEGAPLVVLGEKYLFPQYAFFLNLGGFCNVSFQGQACDITSCNGVLNHLHALAAPDRTEAFDRDGELARSGQVDATLLAELNALSYFAQAPPKSLGWEWVSEALMPILAASEATPLDQLHTFCHHIATQTAQSIAQLGAQGQRLLVTGGGRHNRFLMQCLEQALAPLQVSIADEVATEWVDFKEAIVFAFLGLRVLQGQASTLASATGARHDVVSGSIHLPPTGGFSLL